MTLSSQLVNVGRFRGCLVGALAGDCLGSPFEGDGLGGFRNAQSAQHQLDKTRQHVAAVSRLASSETKANMKLMGLQCYTDDTAMACDIAESLLDCGKFDALHMGKRFSETFHSESFRGYGSNIVSVFEKLRNTDITDPFQPAREQFDGKGSYGNGGAMRTCPVALFHANNLDKTLELAQKQCLLTHTHPDAVAGTMLQAGAVHIALNAQSEQLTPIEFLDRLQPVLLQVGRTVYPDSTTNPYVEKIEQFSKLLESDATPFDAGNTLGNEIAALKSVPAAIFAFIRCLQPNINVIIPVENRLLRTLIYSIAIGGDSDTIGTMTGAIAGAYYGDSLVPPSWATSLEAYKHISSLALRLHSHPSS